MKNYGSFPVYVAPSNFSLRLSPIGALVLGVALGLLFMVAVTLG